MNTPICDFVNQYIKENPLRLHMPGHKGVAMLGYEKYDITEVDGADSLYEASGIIRESEKNASTIFGCDTFYSTEGSSQCIRAMLYLATLYAKNQNRKCKILAGRNAHKAFVSAAALMNLDVLWIKTQSNNSYLSCNIDSQSIELLIQKEMPSAVYITSPDYLGIMSDIKALSEVCKKYGVLLLVDNAHGAYLKFLPESQHPIDLGADICCDSAHKTLPVLTGGAYLHLGDSVADILSSQVKNALALFGSTSPSYLILQSLDYGNKYLCEHYKSQLENFLPLVKELKYELLQKGYTLTEQEPLKITINTKNYGYTGIEFAKILRKNNLICEFYDPDYIVLMLTPQIDSAKLKRLRDCLLSVKKLKNIDEKPPAVHIPKQVMSIGEASFSPMEIIKAIESEGRILSAATVGCPPAVPIIFCGELIDKETIKAFEYYGIKTCSVIK